MPSASSCDLRTKRFAPKGAASLITATLMLASSASSRSAQQLVEDNGFVKPAETMLSGNEKLVSECETQRGGL
jgi:hypothetical protein